jgi:cytochrome c biogenesis protein CcmG/thiol:disulfide interchange protein DsbE
MNIESTRKGGGRTFAILLVAAGVAAGADQPTIRAVLKAPSDRTVAPQFVLRDSSGKRAKLSKYRGKVVLLDFWATWCTGCKKEIPWFSEFQRKYAKEGLAVVGVSMDEDGWKAVKPFLAEHRIPYRMLLGDASTAQSYGIQGMPDTFLIDRRGAWRQLTRQA